MPSPALRRIRAMHTFVFLILLATGCASTTASRPPTSAPPEPRAPAQDPRMERAFAALRPAGALPMLQRLEHNPRLAEAYADAALLYASSDACGMTLLWGQTYRLLAPNGERGAAITVAMKHVLETRTTITREGTGRRASTRLAPGTMPVLALGNGAMMAPFAHRYEIAVGLSLGFSANAGNGTFDEIARTLADYPAAVGSASMPFSAETELSAYLSVLAQNGHLEAYGHWVVSPAYGAEWEAYKNTHGAEVDALVGFMTAHPFMPTVGVRPDDLIDIRASPALNAH